MYKDYNKILKNLQNILDNNDNVSTNTIKNTIEAIDKGTTISLTDAEKTLLLEDINKVLVCLDPIIKAINSQ